MDGQALPDVTYTIGDDVLTQATDSGAGQHLLYDGHGSARQLIASDGSTVDDSFSYDAYGVMLGGNPGPGSSPATNLLYCGEYFDTDMQQYYLRARWYDQQTGRFNRIDPFAGNNHDPQSLHKYLYCHGNPVSNLDPMGRMTLTELTVAISITLFLTMGIQAVAHYGKHARQEAYEIAKGTQAITYLGPGLQEQMAFEQLVTDDPEVLRFNMEWWHSHAEMNKAVTLYNMQTEMNLLNLIDTSYHGLEVAGIGLGIAGGMAKTPIFWSKPHPKANPAHWETIVKNATQRAAKGEAKAIYTNRYLSTVTSGRCKVRMAPDWAEVMPDGRLRIFEVVSPPSQTYNELLEKGWTYRQVLGDTLEYYDILNIGEVAP